MNCERPMYTILNDAASPILFVEHVGGYYAKAVCRWTCRMESLSDSIFPGRWQNRIACTFDEELVSPRMLPIDPLVQEGSARLDKLAWELQLFGRTGISLPWSITTLFDLVKSLLMFFKITGATKNPKLKSSEASWLGRRRAGVGAYGWGSVANCSCSVARSSTFAVAVAIRAHQASTLASDAERNPLICYLLTGNSWHDFGRHR